MLGIALTPCWRSRSTSRQAASFARSPMETLYGHPRLPGRRDLLRLEVQDHPFDAHREAHGRWASTEQFGQALGRRPPRRRTSSADVRGPHLKDGTGVVVQSAHQARIDRDRQSDQLQVAPQLREVLRARPAQVVRRTQRAAILCLSTLVINSSSKTYAQGCSSSATVFSENFEPLGILAVSSPDVVNLILLRQPIPWLLKVSTGLPMVLSKSRNGTH